MEREIAGGALGERAVGKHDVIPVVGCPRNGQPRGHGSMRKPVGTASGPREPNQWANGGTTKPDGVLPDARNRDTRNSQRYWSLWMGQLRNPLARPRGLGSTLGRRCGGLWRDKLETGSATTPPPQSPALRAVSTPSERRPEPSATVLAREITREKYTSAPTTSIAIFQTSFISRAVRGGKGKNSRRVHDFTQRHGLLGVVNQERRSGSKHVAELRRHSGLEQRAIRLKLRAAQIRNQLEQGKLGPG